MSAKPCGRLLCNECTGRQVRRWTGRPAIQSFHFTWMKWLDWLIKGLQEPQKAGAFFSCQNIWFIDCCRDMKKISTKITKKLRKYITYPSFSGRHWSQTDGNLYKKTSQPIKTLFFNYIWCTERQPALSAVWGNNSWSVTFFGIKSWPKHRRTMAKHIQKT